MWQTAAVVRTAANARLHLWFLEALWQLSSFLNFQCYL